MTILTGCLPVTVVTMTRHHRKGEQLEEVEESMPQ